MKFKFVLAVSTILLFSCKKEDVVKQDLVAAQYLVSCDNCQVTGYLYHPSTQSWDNFYYGEGPEFEMNFEAPRATKNLGLNIQTKTKSNITISNQYTPLTFDTLYNPIDTTINGSDTTIIDTTFLNREVIAEIEQMIRASIIFNKDTLLDSTYFGKVLQLDYNK